MAEEERGLSKMPFEAAAALCRVGWHEAWRASLRRSDRAGCLDDGKAGAKKPAEKDAAWHKKQVTRAAEFFTASAPRWLDKPRGARDGAEVGKAILDAAKAAADHTAARRVGLALPPEQAKKAEKAAEEDAMEAWRRFEAATSTLKEHRSVLDQSLADSILELLWACGWHAANVVSDAEIEAAEKKLEEGEGEEDFDEDEEGGQDEDDENDDDSEDEDEKFGAEYLGSSDDAVQDHLAILSSVRELFWDEAVPWQGARLHLLDDAAAVAADVEAIAQVPTFSGPFPKGLNSVRLVLREALSTPKDPLGELARAALARAEAAGLRVLLEVPARAGGKGEDWLRKLSKEAAALNCVRGVALPQAGHELESLKGLICAVRQGGLTQDRCQIFIQAPEPEDEDGDTLDGWTAEFKALHITDLSAADQNALLQDGNVLLERPASIPPKAEGGPEDAQGLLDAASHAADGLQDLGLVSSWNLAVPQGIKFKSKDGPSADWYREYAERWLGAVQSLDGGWFFDAWRRPPGEGAGPELELRAALEAQRLSLAAEDQVIAPTGAKHTHTFVYLHGYMCDGYSYMGEPEYFYKAKKKAKKKSSKSKVSKDDGDEDEEEYEPIAGLKIVLPSAPCRKISAEGGKAWPSWHDYLTDLEGEAEDDLPREELEEVAKRIHAILDREVAAVGAKNVFLGGASQGCGVALYAALTYPGGGLGGLCCTQGHLHSFVEIPKDWLETKTPVFVYHGLADETMPWDKWVAATYNRLASAGADVRVQTEEGVEHCDADREAAWTRHFLTEVLRPASVKKVEAKKSSKKK